MGFNFCHLDGSLPQFFKTHFTDASDAIKDPRRSISIQPCLDAALIVHLLWQTSKSEIYRLRRRHGTRWFAAAALRWIAECTSGK